MDSTNSSIAASSNGKFSKLAPSKRAIFLSTFRRNQEWSLPDSIIYYIAKNPSSSKFYEKLIKSCKYFFIKNPILVIKRITLKYDDEWCTYINDKRVVDLRHVSSKLWITYEIVVVNRNGYKNDQYFAFVASKVAQSDAKKFIAYCQAIDFKEWIWLSSKCEDVWLTQSTAKENYGSVVTLEKIIQALPNIKKFRYDFEDTDPNIVTSDTVKKLVQIPHFLTLDMLELRDLSESFNIDDFYSYIKKNKQTKIELQFHKDHISDAYKQRLQEIVDEIVQTKERGYKVPYIYFYGINRTSFNELWNLHYSRTS